MELIQGRNISSEYSTDTAAVVLNETAVRQFGLGENPLGKQLEMNRTYTVVGVVKDFHFRSMKEEILPLGFHLADPNFARTIMIKAKTDDIKPLLTNIENTWMEFMPHQPLRYHFLDERFNQMYLDEERTGTIFGIFASLAIFIACLGLFALATFMAEQRSKEVSIRKILGASSRQIFQLMTSRFMVLLGIAMVIATPSGYFLMKTWLQDFAYQTPITWDLFATSALVAILIALTSVSYQAMRASIGDPVEALRDE